MPMYEIRVKGHLDERWSTWFDGLTVKHEVSGNTILSGFVVDQAAAAGKEWTSTEVKAVLDAQAEYLTVIGAAGPVPFLAPERGGGPTEE